MNLSISVMAHPSRAEFFPYLSERLGSPSFAIDQNNNLLANCKAAWRLHNPEADFHIVVQDDAIIADNFIERAKAFIAEHPADAYNFFVKEIHPALIKDGVYTDNVTRGGVAICLATRHIAPMLEEFDRQFSRHDDDRINAYIKRNRLKVLFPVPSLVDHRSDLPSLANNKVSSKATQFNIPKIIHQLWVGDKPRPEKWMDTWKEKNPDWEYVLWGNEEIFLREWKNQHLVNAYKDQKKWHGVSDVCTYEILHEFGGFMVGADAICLEPIDELFLDGADAYGVYEQELIRPGLISPLLASIKGGRFAKELIDGLSSVTAIGEPWRTTGNKYMGEMFKKTQQNVKIFPSHYFNPEHFTGVKYTGDGKIYSRQMWGTTMNAYHEGV